MSINYYNEIEKLKLKEEDKEGYKWLFCNFDVIQEKLKKKKPKTLGDIRKICLQEIGFAPAILFSFSHLFESKTVYLKALKKHF